MRMIDPKRTVEMAPAPELMPMGALTYTVACALCTHKRGEDCCKECLCEERSSFALDAGAYDFLRGVPRWIPVEERLPMDDKNVIVCVDGIVVTGYHDERGWFWESDGKAIRRPRVTHWMQLPEPPEEAEDE